jgi:polyhydroxyalkanoate synthesis regulator phasin
MAMNPDNLVQSLQNSLRVTVGAATSIVEGIQDPVKREEAMATFQLDWDTMTEKLAEKGEVTEREAREFVEKTFTQTPSSTSARSSSRSTATRPQTSTQATQELRDLTDELTALRQELEQLRNKDA